MDARSGGRLVLAALLAALAGTTVPAPDTSAATLALDHRCYAEGERIDVAGAGFTPLGRTRLTLSRTDAAPGSAPLDRSDEPVADAAGRVSGAYGVAERTGWFRAGEERFRLRVELADLTNPAIFATEGVWFSRWTVAVMAPGGRLDPDRPAEVRAVGFTGDAGRPLYAHYTREGGKRVRSVRLGTLQGSCGMLTATLDRGFPFRPVPAGRWHVAFNTSATNPRAEGTIAQRAARVRRAIP